MKKILIVAAALASFASPVLAAPPKHRAPVSQDTLSPYAHGNPAPFARQPDVVTFGNRMVGEDPDVNIRTQMLHDPVVSEY